MARLSIREVDIIAPNFKKRLSGVTSTIAQLVPQQRAQGARIAALGPKGSLPENVPMLGWGAVFGLWQAPQGRPYRLWHARRNVEMLAGIIMRDILRMKLRLIFTSAAQRHHKAFTKYLIGKMDKVIATSARSGSYLRVPYQVIRHGVDLSAFTPPATAADKFAAAGLPGHYVIGCFGRIRYQKGTDLFVEAMVSLLPRYPQWTAVISGRITPEHKAFAEALKEKIAQAGLSERIIFLGEVPDIRPWYQSLTLYVAPSRNEGFGLTPLEAFASQTAVVASNAGAYPELVAPGTGAIVPAGDEKALEQAIEPYLAAPQMALAAGQAGLAHVRAHFPLKHEAEAINRVYEELLQEAAEKK
ncbi:MAG: glycosyltransferase family 1 protein [Candidatus Tokpelaia sp.]|nr:MAG: glycosyltransferase family 1 protein [Candidatus Tokpelaia sp.]KAA6207422.1 MAG: glycosyltransferase family 1 protein [Candidatus Tokpelaia sp.]